MPNYNNQQKKFLTNEVVLKIMECFMGLNNKNKKQLSRMTQKPSKKLVDAYYDCIKAQHRKAKAQTRKVKKHQHPKAINAVEQNTMANLIAS